MSQPKTSDNNQIKIKMPNPSQELPVSSKAPNQDLKDMDVLCYFKIKVSAIIWSMVVSKTSDHIQIKFKMPNPNEEPLIILQSPK